MGRAITINSRIIEGLYTEALVLSDDVRHAFARSSRMEAGKEEDATHVAMSNEGLRTTTRMMHAVAWLLDHRAHFAGELSDFQLRRYGRLVPDMRACEPDQLALLSPETRNLVQATVSFYDRLLRLDSRWHHDAPPRLSAVDRLRERMEGRLVG